jgi:SH3-like domain-containing protein
MQIIKKLITWILFLSILFIFPSNAQEKFLSLKKSKVNVRYGPSFDSPIKFIYKKINLPLKQIDKKENWRRIIDSKNNSGWIHWRMLKNSNSIIILENKILFKKPSNFSKPIVRLEKGRLLVIKKCENYWCNIVTDKYSGWVKTDNIWGRIN